MLRNSQSDAEKLVFIFLLVFIIRLFLKLPGKPNWDRRDRVSPILACLHVLPVKYRIYLI